jgi:drug/metabolite transporter (DMT)-like permease
LTLTALALILASAGIHAGWNLLSKRNGATLAFFLAAVLAACLALLPVGVALRGVLTSIPWQVWGLLAATGACQAVYYFGLAGAYRRGELSVVYPLARALPVLLVAGVSLALGRGESITSLGLAGMALVAAGCFVLPLQSFRLAASGLRWNAVVLLAGLAALGTTGYTLIDDAALRWLRELPGIGVGRVELTLLYSFLETVSLTVWTAALVALQGAERVEFTALDRRLWGRAAVAGIGMVLAYGLVLLAMGYVRDVSYVSAFRQVSIPLGALVGLWVEKEPAYPPKLAGIGLITLGLALVALW